MHDSALTLSNSPYLAPRKQSVLGTENDRMSRHNFDFFSLYYSVLVLFAQAQDGLCQTQRFNVSYGPDTEQILDIYSPASNGAPSSKVIVLVHGGGWSAGDKAEMNEFVPSFQTGFPNYTIANINYRLGNKSSPGYPKQVQDIDSALKFLASELQIASPEFALFGGSAGAHLSMLYAYGFDKNSNVKVVGNVVGPTDFLDLALTLNPIFNSFLPALVGPPPFIFPNLTLYKEVSPVTYITVKSPPTISFYGLLDILVPITQSVILKSKLDQNNVPNEFNTYLGTHYFDWSAQDKLQMRAKAVNFFKLYL